MKTKSKIIIASSVLAVGAIATTSALIPSMLKKETQNITIETKDIKNPIIDSVVVDTKEEAIVDSTSSTTIENSKTETNIVEDGQTQFPPIINDGNIDNIDNQFKKLSLSFKQLNKDSLGKAGFYFEVPNDVNGGLYNDEILASFGDKVFFRVAENDKDNITLTDLRVFVNDNEAWSLGVYHVEGDRYMIEIPSEDSAWAKELNENSVITFKAYFGPIKLNDWVYDFNSRTYAIKINGSMIDSQTNSFIFDDVNIESQKIVVLEESPTFIKPLQFRVYLNGYNVTIKNLTIPKGTQLEFINKSEYGNSTTNKQVPIIDLYGGYRSMYAEDRQLKIDGAIGRFGDVEYSNSMKAACGIAVILESDDLDQEWIEKQNK
ncbi:hypothetical protein ACJA29_03610 [Metamycoplasma sualvi]|uniref:hypothetical protein n=1 Tax=Metamycoplasma sualvi TaxID=2125 RepID=UPI0038738EBC